MWMKVRRGFSPDRCAKLGVPAQGVTKSVGARRMVRCQVKTKFQVNKVLEGSEP